MNRILFVFIASLLIACNDKTEQNENAHHDEGIEALAYTLYSDKTEIFVEFKPLIAGVNTKFAAHFTILGEYFKPLTKGEVTVSLIVNNETIKQTTTSPNVPGIYRLSLQPRSAGKGELIFDIKTPEFTDRQIIRDVTIYPDEKTAIKDHKPEAGESNDITYLKEQAWKVEFANAPVIIKPFHNVIKTSGHILSAPGDEIIVTAKAGGIVRLSGTNSLVGSAVKEGALLFIITGGDLAEGNIDASIKEAKANYEKAKANYERSRDLVKDKIVSEKEFLQDSIGFENAKITYNMMSKGYTGNGQNITSPMTGFVKSISVSDGQFVSAGTPLASISKNSKLILHADVSQKYFDLLPSIKSANFKTSNSTEYYSTENENGKLISYGKSATEGSPFIPIAFEINGIPGIIPGSVAEVYLKFNEIPKAIIIPISALIEEQGSFFVYVQTAGESFQKREIKTGASDGIYVQVLSGISEGERIVTKGAYQIKLSTASGTLPAHGHEH